jgi:hypothetical protein
MKMLQKPGRRAPAVQDFVTFTYDKTLTASQQLEDRLLLDSDKDFVLQAITGSRSGLYSAKITDTGIGRNLQNYRVQDDNFAGNAQNPNYLMHPAYFARGSAIGLDLLDRSGGSNTIQLGFHGYLVVNPPLPTMVYNESWYQLSTDRQALTANGKQDVAVLVDQRGDFVLQKIVSSQTGAFQLQILDSRSNTLLTKSLTNNTIIAGTAQRPFILPQPRFIGRGTTILVTLKDTSGSSNTVELVMEGYRVF